MSILVKTAGTWPKASTFNSIRYVLVSGPPRVFDNVMCFTCRSVLRFTGSDGMLFSTSCIEIICPTCGNPVYRTII